MWDRRQHRRTWRKGQRQTQGCFWKDTRRSSHGNPTTPTPTGERTWVTVLWKQHVSAGWNSKVIKTGVEGTGQIRSTVRIPCTGKIFTKPDSKSEKKTQPKRSPTPRSQSWRLFRQLSKWCHGRQESCECEHGQHTVQVMNSVPLEQLGAAAQPGYSPARERAALHSSTHRNAGVKGTTRQPRASGPAASPVPLQHPSTQQSNGNKGLSPLYYHLMLQITTSSTDNGYAANGKVKPVRIF